MPHRKPNPLRSPGLSKKGLQQLQRIEALAAGADPQLTPELPPINQQERSFAPLRAGQIVLARSVQNTDALGRNISAFADYMLAQRVRLGQSSLRRLRYATTKDIAPFAESKSIALDEAAKALHDAMPTSATTPLTGVAIVGAAYDGEQFLLKASHDAVNEEYQAVREVLGHTPDDMRKNGHACIRIGKIAAYPGASAIDVVQSIDAMLMSLYDAGDPMVVALHPQMIQG